LSPFIILYAMAPGTENLIRTHTRVPVNITKHHRCRHFSGGGTRRWRWMRRDGRGSGGGRVEVVEVVADVC
jgi:hypothetical protein